MKSANYLIGLFLLIAGMCNSQSTSKTMVGNYVGEFTWEKTVGKLQVLADNTYLLEIYDWRGDIEKTIRGRWAADGEKLVLTEKVGKVTVLEHNNDMWYIVGDNGYSCIAKFYYNVDLKEYMGKRKGAGC